MTAPFPRMAMLLVTDGRLLEPLVSLSISKSVYVAARIRMMVSMPLPAGQPPVAVSVLAASRNVQLGPPVLPDVVVTTMSAADAADAQQSIQAKQAETRLRDRG